jgi:hypothetical protein
VKVFCRMIHPSWWMEGQPNLAQVAISGDVVKDVRSDDALLSFWTCNSTQIELDEIALAISSVFKKPEGMHVLLLSEEEINSLNCMVVASPGRTKVERLSQRHRDVGFFDIDLLNKLISLMAVRTREPSQGDSLSPRVRSYPLKKLITLIRTAVSAGDLDESKLEQGWRERLARL